MQETENSLMKKLWIVSLYSTRNTVAADIFKGKEYPWEILPELGDFICQLGESLPENEYEKLADNIWAAKDAKIAASAEINGPCIIDKGAEIRHCAYIRGNAVIGKNAVVGNSTEIKNALLFDGVQVPHFNYVGDSVLGYKSHLGAGAVTSNVKSDKTTVSIRINDPSGTAKIDTGRKKVGAFVGDYVEVGCNSVLCPGTVIGCTTTVYPLSRVRGYIPEDSIFKSDDNIVIKNK